MIIKMILRRMKNKKERKCHYLISTNKTLHRRRLLQPSRRGMCGTYPDNGYFRILTHYYKYLKIDNENQNTALVLEHWGGNHIGVFSHMPFTSIL